VRAGAAAPKGNKERERGRRVEDDKFGPLKEWRVVYSKAGAQVGGTCDGGGSLLYKMLRGRESAVDVFLGVGYVGV